MSELLRDTALVLRVTPFSETSLILTLFGRNHGKFGALAKGARRKVKYGSTLAIEPCYELEVVWGHKATRELQIVREFTLVNSHYSLRRSLESITIAHSVAELLLRCMKDDDPHPELFDLARVALQTCSSTRTTLLPVLWKFELELLRQTGLAPGIFEPGTANVAGLGGESVSIMRKLGQVSFETLTRLRPSQKAEQEIMRWFAVYYAQHLSLTSPPRSLGALRWARTNGI